MGSCKTFGTALRALTAACGLAVVAGAAQAQAVEAGAGLAGDRPAVDTQRKLHIGEIMDQLVAHDNFAGRFGLRVPVLDGTVCTFEDTNNWSGPWDLSDSGGFFFNGSAFAIADNFAIDDAGGTLPSAVINTICTEGVYASGGVLPNGDTIPDQFEISYWGIDSNGLPDVFEVEVLSPSSLIQPFVEGVNLTKLETPNQNFFGGASSIFQLSHADVTFETETCYAIQIQNNQAASGGATLFLATGSVATLDGESLQDTNASLDFTSDEGTGADVAIALYNSTTDNWDLDFFLVSTRGGPNDPLGTGEGLCNFFDIVPEPDNGFCPAAITLADGVAQLFDMDVPSVEKCSFGRAGTYVENCPIGTLGVNTDIVGNFGLFYKFTGDGTEWTISTCGSASTQNTILMVYAESDPTNPCAVLYCVAGDDDGCGVTLGPAELNVCTVAGQVYIVLIQSSGLTEGEIIATSGAACTNFAQTNATTDGEIQMSTLGVPEGETCAQGDGGNGINDGCFGPTGLATDAETIAVGDVRTGTASNLNIPIAARGPDMDGFGPEPAADLIDVNLRDEDTYNINITEPGILVFSGNAEFPFELQIRQYSAIDPMMGLTGCEAVASLVEVTSEREGFASATALVSAAGLYGLTISHSDESPYLYDCASGEVDYAVTVEFTAFSALELDPANFPMVVQEPDPCGVNQPGDSNQGCAAITPNIGPALLNGQTYYGQVAAQATAFGTFRDIDQFSFTVGAGGGLVTLSIDSELPWVANLIENQSQVCGDVLAGPGGGVGSSTLQYTLPAGSYSFLFTEANFNTAFNCASGSTEYAINLDIAALPGFTSGGPADASEAENFCGGVPYATVPNDANSGCSASPIGSVAGTVAEGELAAGSVGTTTATDGSIFRDVDSWDLTVAGAGDYELSINTQVALGVLIQDESDCGLQLAVRPTYEEALAGAGAFLFLPGQGVLPFSVPAAGTYTVTVFPAFFGGADCAIQSSSYELSFAAAAGDPCPTIADFTVDGACTPLAGDDAVTLADFSCFLSEWSAGTAAADITAEGTCVPGSGGDGVTLSDFSCFLGEWSGGCDGDPGTPL